MQAGQIRRGAGGNVLRTISWRSRNGGTRLYHNINANSLYRFDGQRFAADATGHFYRNGISIKTGLNGNRLSFAKMPPSVGAQDYLYVGNSGSPFKVDSSGNITNWGIVAPSTAPTLALGSQEALSIDTMDTGDAANWTNVSGFQVGTITDSSTLHQVGTSTAVKVAYTQAASTPSLQIVINNPITVDLTKYADLTPSTLQDLITLWIGVDYIYAIQYIELQFNLASNRSDYYNYKLAITPASFQTSNLQASGVNTILGGTAANNLEATFVQAGQVPSLGFVQDPAVQQQLLAGMHRTNMTASALSWYQMVVSKSEFTRVGTNMAKSWANVVSVDLKITTAPNLSAVSIPFNVYFNLLAMIGAVGMEGNYQCAVAFANSTAGTISNPSPNTNGIWQTINGVQRQPILWSNIPISPDPQVDTRVLYRSLGNGALLFFLDTINDNTTTTYTDTVADFPGFNGGGEPKILGNTIEWPVQLGLLFSPPPDPPTMIAGPYQGCMFWLDATHQGRVYFSPQGYPEGEASFIEVTFNDDPLQTLIIWNGNLYLLSQKHLYYIQNVSTNPLVFTANAILGAPGTLNPFSAVAGKVYLFWQSGEGWMGFNGFTAQPFGMTAMSLPFRGENAEDLFSMSVATAIYVKGEVIMTDASTQTFGVDENTQTWRNLGIVYNALYYEDDLEQYVATTAEKNIIVCEQPGVFIDDTSPIVIDFQAPSVVLGEDVDVVLRRMVLDINTALNSTTAQTLTPHPHSKRR